MFLTVSKRLEFSASRRLWVPGRTSAENSSAFGPETSATYGTGRNYVAYFVFSGPINPTNGMLINISEMKERAGGVLHEGYDHKFLNEDNPAFRDKPPTVENVARELFLQLAPRFNDVDARLVACHLSESPERSATFYADGALEANYWFEFSAARRTMSPHLSKAENEQLFGAAASMHGHNYGARLTFREENAAPDVPVVPSDRIESCIQSLRAELDHRDLNHDVPGMKDRAMTTENLAGYIFQRVHSTQPLHRIRLHERRDFFAEVWHDNRVALALRMPLFAAHRLHAASLSTAENLALYGKCHNSLGHGHRYLVESTIGGELDARSGTLYDFVALRDGLQSALEPWQNRHLDRETEEFRDTPSTGENIVSALWPRVNARVEDRLTRLRLWETQNNRFTLRTP